MKSLSTVLIVWGGVFMAIVLTLVIAANVMSPDACVTSIDHLVKEC